MERWAEGGSRIRAESIIVVSRMFCRQCVCVLFTTSVHGEFVMEAGEREQGTEGERNGGE